MKLKRIAQLAPPQLDTQQRLLADICSIPNCRGFSLFSHGGMLCNNFLKLTYNYPFGKLRRRILIRSDTVIAYNSTDHEQCSCGEALNQFHIMSNCRLRSRLYSDRHNQALASLVELLKVRGDVFREPVIKHDNSVIKPDIILVEPSKPDTAIVIDLQVVYERSEKSFETAASSKIQKYLSCFRSIRIWLRRNGWPDMKRIKCKAFIFGARGSLFRKSLSLLKDRFDIPKTKIEAICDRIFDYSTYILGLSLSRHLSILNSPLQSIDVT